MLSTIGVACKMFVSPTLIYDLDSLSSFGHAKRAKTRNKGFIKQAEAAVCFMLLRKKVLGDRLWDGKQAIVFAEVLIHSSDFEYTSITFPGHSPALTSTKALFNMTFSSSSYQCKAPWSALPLHLSLTHAPMM